MNDLLRSIVTLQDEAGRLRLSGGEVLFRQGDPPDCLYVVVHGRLEVILERADGGREVVDQVGPGECIGEMALLADEPRSATIQAIRDSELVRLSKDKFDLLLDRYPRTATEIARTLVRRLRQTTSGTAPQRRVATIALVPANGARIPPGFADRFVRALSASGGSTLHLNKSRLDLELGEESAACLAGDPLPARALNWLNEQESRFRHVVYETDPTASGWTGLCLRQADLILVVAPDDSDPRTGEIESRMTSGALGRPVTRKELVLLHSNGSNLPGGTTKWLADRRFAAHHHVRLDRDEDYSRLARFATGTAVGLVFGGGGARGYLHIGVVQALRECGIPIDLVGGTSIGSMAAALCALDYDIDRMIEISTQGYGKKIGLTLLRDTTVPVVAFVSARRSVKILKEVFGETRIEDLWLPYFCVSANLSTAEVVLHERGPLWFGIRASSSLPGILPPVVTRGEMLVDGGLLNNLPVDIMRSRAGTVIASDIALPVDLTVSDHTYVALSGWPLLWNLINPFAEKKSLPHIFNILSRTATLSTIHSTETFKKHADLYIHPLAAGVATLDWKAGRKLIEAGYRHALAEIEKWRTTGVCTCRQS